MCGIAGALALGGGLVDSVRKMTDTLHHRGPDDSGVWVDEAAGIGLGHRRLSILDLSPAGHQPMISACGRWVIAFNGEIYNHQTLRSELTVANAAPAWRGHSDTETLLAAFAHWGVEATLQRCVGMFAIALWDAQTRVFTLVRDRFGEKPLYYGWVGRGPQQAFVFGSELKALRAYPGFDAPVCRQALAQYLRFTYVPAPRSIYQGIYKLEPACRLTVQGCPPAQPPSHPLRPGDAWGSVRVNQWWSFAQVVQEGAKQPLHNEAQALDLLEQQLNEAVRIQSLADVPLGAFLSGGVDSSMIAALMQRQASRPIQTFTIGFDEAGFDEAPHARAVAQHLGTQHHEMRVSSSMAQDVIPLLPWMYDEPFADSSQIPTHLVCKAARQYVTVALSGDAGDELFGGYNRYFWGPRIWSRLAWVPLPLRQALGHALQSVPMAAWDQVIAFLFRGNQGINRLGDKVHKLASRLKNVRSSDDLYASLVSEWSQPCDLVLGIDGQPCMEPASLLQDEWPATGVDAAQLRMMYRDTTTYLTDDILCKVDRAAMATSLETRVPFLDHRVVELAWRLPLQMKVRKNTGKWALRQVLYKHVPRALIERPKAGFAVPVGQWLRGPLRPWAEMLLAPERLRTEGFFRAAPITSVWQAHLNGQDRTTQLWPVLMFQAWLEKQRSDEGSSP